MLGNVLCEERHAAHIVQQIRLIICVQVNDVVLLRPRGRRCRCRCRCVVVVGLVLLVLLAQRVAVSLGAQQPAALLERLDLRLAAGLARDLAGGGVAVRRQILRARACRVRRGGR
eukprot:COSAG01_NODE_220_length_21453_cov_118.998361_17_plen_115_part_00